MITKVEISNFKRFEFAEIELGERVIFIGPNNAGKTTCLQALALWHFGLVEWFSKKSDKNLTQRTGITLNRKDLINIPISKTILLWKNLHVKKSAMSEGRQTNENIKIKVWVEGVNRSKFWRQGFEFDYANSESIYCRPIENQKIDREIFKEIIGQKIAFLQPMSGLAPVEPKLEMGRINVLLGEGQTAQILRNLCYHVYSQENIKWKLLNDRIFNLFQVRLSQPDYDNTRGEINLSYYDSSNLVLDLTSSGRGFQQMLLLLAYLYANPHSVLLLDEPDAHLEILRQRQMYQVLSEVSNEQNSQVIIASHSEVLLNEAAERDIVLAFIGKPHRIDVRGRSQLVKSLRDIGFDQYYLAEQKGWVLYLEGATDLAVLQSIAKKLNHSVSKHLERPFVHYVDNLPNEAEKHYYGLREAKNDLVAIAIFDRLDKQLNSKEYFYMTCWKKKEIENYFITKEVLLSYVVHDLVDDDLFSGPEKEKRTNFLTESLTAIENAQRVLGRPDVWSDDIKITDEFLDPLFKNYFEKMQQPNLMRKSDYFELINFYPVEEINPEVIEKLDAIARIAEKALPETGFKQY